MMSHGHVAEAVDYLSAPNLSGAYLFGAARQPSVARTTTRRASGSCAARSPRCGFT
jgi:hypothetical protein